MTVTVLAIESSCDETAAAVVRVAPDGKGEILANIVYSQTAEHRDYGGVVPEIAARAHVDKMDGIVDQALTKAALTLGDIDAFAATSGPGLLGGLLVGVSYAKSLALAYNKPFLAVNHLEGHALTCRLTDHVPFPYLLLLTSGGHCLFIAVQGVGNYTTLGGTIDDAAGEAFDKVAKLMGLPFPGGPMMEKTAESGNPKAYAFPIPLRNEGLDFSFSGLKTAARQTIMAAEPLSDATRADIAASFQHTVAETLALKSRRALKHSGSPRLVVAGGVAANKTIRAALKTAADSQKAAFFVPPIQLCTDNAAMIAYAGAVRLLAGEKDDLAAAARPRWPLDERTGKKP